jgi:hypothetical protein
MPLEQRRGRRIAMDTAELDAFQLVPDTITSWDFRKLPG